jgi:hypothetical protein
MIAIGVVAIPGVLLVLWAFSRIIDRKVRSPMDKRRTAAAQIIIGVIGWAVISAPYLLAASSVGPWMLLMPAAFLVVVVGYTLWAIRPSTERDHQKNFALKPGFCGRCDYDLTGNTTGICPECGWSIPEKPIPVEDPNWQRWWRGWRIDYLEHWRWRLTLRVILLVVLTWIVFSTIQPFHRSDETTYRYGILALIWVPLFPNIIRLFTYAVRRRPG